MREAQLKIIKDILLKNGSSQDHNLAFIRVLRCKSLDNGFGPVFAGRFRTCVDESCRGKLLGIVEAFLRHSNVTLEHNPTPTTLNLEPSTQTPKPKTLNT